MSEFNKDDLEERGDWFVNNAENGRRGWYEDDRGDTLWVTLPSDWVDDPRDPNHQLLSSDWNPDYWLYQELGVDNWNAVQYFGVDYGIKPIGKFNKLPADSPVRELKPITAEKWAGIVTKFKKDFKTHAEPRLRINFNSTYFVNVALFNGAHFARDARFDGAHFAKSARFDDTHFAGVAHFDNAYFTSLGFFDGVHFAIWAYFEDAHFADDVDFDGTHFAKSARFDGASFGKQTVFSNAHFKSHVPSFHGVEKLYSDTRFELDGTKWPDPTNKPDSQENNYNYLRYLTNKALLHDAERFFEKQILRVKEAQDWQAVLPPKDDEGERPSIEERDVKPLSERWWTSLASSTASKIYGFSSDYGHSWLRPLLLLIPLIFLTALGVEIIGTPACTKPNCVPLDSLELATNNAFGFLGFKRYLFARYVEFAPMLKILLGIQAVMSIALLFLFGLGIRSRFRVK